MADQTERVLVVEDNRRLAASLRKGLTEAGYDVVCSHRARDAAEKLGEAGCDLVVLDLGLPDGDGLELLRDARAEGLRAPVLILTARDTVDDRVQGLDGGADDYLVKPFAFAELVARLRALSRRRTDEQCFVIETGDLHIDLSQRLVRRGGQPIELTPREFDLLVYLARREGLVVSREMLAAEVWRETSRATPLDNVIDVHMSHLRRKLCEGGRGALLHVVRGVGIVLRAAE